MKEDPKALESATYVPAHRMRICIRGALHNAANTLNHLYQCNEATRKEHAIGRDEEDPCYCSVCAQTDWAGFEAATLEEIADNLATLDGDPAELFAFADLYALHGVAGATLQSHRAAWAAILERSPQP